MRVALILLLMLPALAEASIREIDRIHRSAIAQHSYISDMDQYGVADKWVASLVGDCEDFALYMQIELRSKGYQADLWLVKTETDELHVVVKVGDIVIDNRRKRALPKRFFDYRWMAPIEYYNKNNVQLSGL